MRNMSFAITTRQFRDRSKDVTRRLGWWFLKPGDLLQGVEKSQGLKKGEKIVKLGIIRVVSTRPERINEITQADVIREGFPEMNEAQFLDMFCQSHKGCIPTTTINRIEYEYVEDQTTMSEITWEQLTEGEQNALSRWINIDREFVNEFEKGLQAKGLIRIVRIDHHRHQNMLT